MSRSEKDLKVTGVKERSSIGKMAMIILAMIIHTFTSSEGQSIKLIIAPTNAPEGIITWSCGLLVWDSP